MTFNDFVHKYNLKNKATPKMKIYRALSFLGLTDVGIYSRDGPFESDIGFFNIHPSKRMHWVCYIYKKYFDSYGCV